MNRYADDTDKADERGLLFIIYNSIAQLFGCRPRTHLIHNPIVMRPFFLNCLF